MESIKDTFKDLIREFHNSVPPMVKPRELRLPGWCLESPPVGHPPRSSAQAVVITGPRRSGKTFFLYQLMQQLCEKADPPLSKDRLLYIDLQDDRLFPLEASDLSALFEAYFELHPENAAKGAAFFLDEVHCVDGWDLFVRNLLNNNELRIFITCSTSRFGDLCLAASVPRHFVPFKLMPLSFREYIAFKGVSAENENDVFGMRHMIHFLLDEYLIYGGYPEVAFSELPAKLKVLRTYYDILIYKDMVGGFAIRNIRLLKGLIKYLFTRVGSTVSLHGYYLGLLGGSHVSRDTLLEYVSYLEKEDLISLVPVLSDSLGAKNVNPRKVFCLDNGLRNAVSFRLTQDDERLAQNVVFQELKRGGKQIYYWKDRGHVDFVAMEDKKLMGINVSYGREVDPSKVNALLALSRALGRREADLSVITKDIEKVDRGVRCIPLWKWLLVEH